MSTTTDKLERHRYYNSGSGGVAIVAKSGGVHDYAAYIGAGSSVSESEEQTVEFVKRTGTKIDQELAEFLFPEFKQQGFVWRH